MVKMTAGDENGCWQKSSVSNMDDIFLRSERTQGTHSKNKTSPASANEPDSIAVSAPSGVAANNSKKKHIWMQTTIIMI